MSYSGINQGNVKSNNRSAVRKLLNDRGPMSRKDIAAALGLTSATVTLICNEMLAAGVLVELGELEEAKRAGRKKILVGIDYDSRYVLCISVETNETIITVCNMRGEPRASRTLPSPAGHWAEFLSEVADVSKALLWEQEIPKSAVLGIGVTVPGPVDREKGTVLRSSWDSELSICDFLEDRLGYPVILENNVKAFAQAEQIYGCGKELSNLMFIKWGPGVGAALILQQGIYEGRCGKAAELGHMTVERGGKLCSCGKRGCLETVVSSRAMAEQIRSLCSPEGTPELYRLVEGDASAITHKNIGIWAAAEDEAVWNAISGDINEFARMVSNALTFVAPDRVVIYGEMFELPRFRECFLHYCKEYDPAYDEKYIVTSSLNDRISYIGPLAAAVRELFFDDPNTDKGR